MPEQKPRIFSISSLSLTWSVLLCARWKFGLLMALASFGRTRTLRTRRESISNADAGHGHADTDRARPYFFPHLRSPCTSVVQCCAVCCPAAAAAAADYDTAAVAPKESLKSFPLSLSLSLKDVLLCHLSLSQGKIQGV